MVNWLHLYRLSITCQHKQHCKCVTLYFLVQCLLINTVTDKEAIKILYIRYLGSWKEVNLDQSCNPNTTIAIKETARTTDNTQGLSRPFYANSVFSCQCMLLTWGLARCILWLTNCCSPVRQTDSEDFSLEGFVSALCFILSVM